MFSFSVKQILVLFLLCLITAAGVYWYASTKLFASVKNENSTVVLDKIKTVTKLITVEGNFSELYNYKESYDYDYLNLFTKKMILRVNARVSAGYNFEKMQLTIDSLSRKVTLKSLPKPEILSIDHDVDYYDISEGVFTSFTPEEHTLIHKKAKALIEQKAIGASLLAEAEKQKSEYLKMMQMALQSSGWTLEVTDATMPSNLLK